MTLESEQAVINFIGKRTVLKFEMAVDGVLCYRTIIPKEMNGELVDIEIYVFFTDLNAFFDFDTIEKLIFNKQIFEVRVMYHDGAETVYHRKYIDPSNN